MNGKEFYQERAFFFMSGKRASNGKKTNKNRKIKRKEAWRGEKDGKKKTSTLCASFCSGQRERT